MRSPARPERPCQPVAAAPSACVPTAAAAPLPLPVSSLLQGKEQDARRTGLPRAYAPHLHARLPVRRSRAAPVEAGEAAASGSSEGRRSRHARSGTAAANWMGHGPCIMHAAAARRSACPRRIAAAALTPPPAQRCRSLPPPPALLSSLVWRRQKGYISLSTYLTNYKLGEYVDIKVNGAVHKVRAAGRPALQLMEACRRCSGGGRDVSSPPPAAATHCLHRAAFFCAAGHAP